jgi:hypothetical protein
MLPPVQVVGEIRRKFHSIERRPKGAKYAERRDSQRF